MIVYSLLAVGFLLIVTLFYSMSNLFKSVQNLLKSLESVQVVLLEYAKRLEKLEEKEKERSSLHQPMTQFDLPTQYDRSYKPTRPPVSESE